MGLVTDPSARTALVLSGGGARGAYEAGVLAYLRTGLPESVRSRVRFDVISGTSVGAINACWMAATADDPKWQARRLVELWSTLELEHALGVATFRVLRLGSMLLGGRAVQPGILDPTGVYAIVRNEIPWHRIGENMANGVVSGLSVSATDVASGRTVVFIQRAEPGLPAWSRDPHVVPVRVEMGPDHALASAAIPLLFKPVAVDGTLYVDGGLRQNTPLSPALRLGADRVMVVAMRVERPLTGKLAETGAVSLPLLFGKVLNALLLDHLDYDLDRLRRFNRLLEAMQQSPDPTVKSRVQESMMTARGMGYRQVKDLLIRPSDDIGLVAAHHAQRIRKSGRLSGLAARLFEWAAGDGGEADLLSYLLFDGPFARDLIDMGMRDAAAHRDELIDFFS
jgi:NTE family protein